MKLSKREKRYVRVQPSDSDRFYSYVSIRVGSRVWCFIAELPNNKVERFVTNLIQSFDYVTQKEVKTALNLDRVRQNSLVRKEN